VMSFDLVSDSPFVVEADICGKLPLPGSESGEGKIVDVVVCSLSLMSLNWLQCIREARRVLKDRLACTSFGLLGGVNHCVMQRGAQNSRSYEPIYER